MYLAIRNSDNVIVAKIEYVIPADKIDSIEEFYQGIDHTVIEIADEEYEPEMLGAIYNA